MTLTLVKPAPPTGPTLPDPSKPAEIPPEPRWIIEKQDRRCGNMACAGSDVCNARAKVDKDGKITAVCRLCGETSERRADSYKERRPCKTCKFVRDVTVKLWSSGVGQPLTPHFEEHCGICLLDRAARSHENTAAEFRTRARRLRAQRTAKYGT